jgi:hypothetical protein
MAILAQGTQVYFIDPNTSAITPVVCATTFSPGGNPADQIETTCLEDSDRAYLPGLRTPGQASLGINADPDNASHLRLFVLANTNPPPVLQWAIGWSDGTAAPTSVNSAGDFVLPTTRTWYTFEGYVADFPFDFAQNTVVTSAIAIQRSGAGAWTAKV